MSCQHVVDVSLDRFSQPMPWENAKQTDCEDITERRERTTGFEKAVRQYAEAIKTLDKFAPLAADFVQGSAAVHLSLDNFESLKDGQKVECEVRKSNDYPIAMKFFIGECKVFALLTAEEATLRGLLCGRGGCDHKKRGLPRQAASQNNNNNQVNYTW